MEVYLTIHILLFITCIFELSKNMRLKKMVIILWSIFFTFFGGLRWGIGPDWYQYYSHFVNSNWDNIFNYDRYGNGQENLEPFFVFINVLIKSLFGEFYIYNLITTGFIQYTNYKFCTRMSTQSPLLLYAFLMILASNYFTVRAGLSQAILLWSFIAIKEKKFKLYLVSTLIAVFIHYQCIVFIPSYWLLKWKKGISNWLICSTYIGIAILRYKFQNLFTLITIFISGGIGDKAMAYTEKETIGSTGPSYLGWGLNFFFLCIYLYIRKKENNNLNVYYNTLLILVLIYNSIFMIFSDGMGDLARLAGLFVPAQIILLVHSLEYFIYGKGKKFKLLAIIFFIAYYIYKIKGIGNGYYFELQNIPYTTIFD
mgnify:CR=1 FL=1